MQWISVKDRLPETHKEVICFHDTGKIVMDLYGHMGFTYIPYGDVTHWMPLPEPPLCLLTTEQINHIIELERAWRINYTEITHQLNITK